MKLKRKYILPLLGLVLIVIQVFRIDKSNPPIEKNSEFIVALNTPTNIATNIKAACYDCHSYETKYPWYTDVAPLNQLMQNIQHAISSVLASSGDQSLVQKSYCSNDQLRS